MKIIYTSLVVFILFFTACANKNETISEKMIQVGTFNIEWFPCKDDGEMMKTYGIELRYPPQGDPTDIEALFQFLKKIDLELIGVVEIVDTQMFERLAQRYLGEAFEFIYAPGAGSQRVGFLYDSSVLELIGEPRVYNEVKLSPTSWLRPAFGGYFRSFKNGFDFHAVVTHLKAGPAGKDKRLEQWAAIENLLTTLSEETGDDDIILMGDMNNVSSLKENEFLPVIKRLNYYWATAELAADSSFSSYWQPDYRIERIEGSLIDHIFISADAQIEYLPNSAQNGGMCSEGKKEYLGEAIPAYHQKISDHCPVWVSFKADVDND
jgi:hypothetical protein